MFVSTPTWINMFTWNVQWDNVFTIAGQDDAPDYIYKEILTNDIVFRTN